MSLPKCFYPIRRLTPSWGRSQYYCASRKAVFYARWLHQPGLYNVKAEEEEKKGAGYTTINNEEEDSGLTPQALEMSSAAFEAKEGKKKAGHTAQALETAWNVEVKLSVCSSSETSLKCFKQEKEEAAPALQNQSLLTL